MTSLVFLVEEPSMKELLNGVLPRMIPPEVHFDIIPHEGKSDLKKSIPRKLRAWQVPGARFVILIDQDANQCKKLKKEIVELCREAGCEDALVRIVCRSLEAWVLGDLTALATAFDAPSIVGKRSVAKFRAPDKLGDPVREVRALVPGYGKTSGARAVGPHLNVAASRNQSRSFNVFVEGLSQVLSGAR